MNLDNTFRKLVLDMLGLFKKPSSGIHILNGHFLESFTEINNQDHFYFLLSILNKSFNFLELSEACEIILSGNLPSRPHLVFTFDDGFKECYTDIAPVLEFFHTRGAFFINPSVIESSESFRINFLKNALNVNFDKEFMNWENIKNLQKRGHLIGNHTMNHLALKNLSYEEAYNDVYLAKLKLEDVLNFKCDYFALPFGTSKYFDQIGIDAALKCHSYIFTSCSYENYFYNCNSKIFNRRHFEGNWPAKHINYFTSTKRKL